MLGAIAHLERQLLPVEGAWSLWMSERSPCKRYDSNGFVARDEEREEVVVSLRGSQ